MAHIIELAASGHNGMVKILYEAGQALGVSIANLITLFAPPKVILAGSALQAGPLLLGPLHDAVRAATPKSLADVAEFVVHNPGDDMWARGAAALALRDLYGSPWTRSVPAR
jgi:predicted NBD/HSP70 family sugar kinase